MPSPKTLPLALLCCTAVLAGCATGSGAKTAKVIPQPPPATVAPRPVPAPLVDPVAVLIAQSDSHFATGQQELTLGHLERARNEFDRSLDILLESADGARANVRLREHFDRLVDRISVLEQGALYGWGETEFGIHHPVRPELVEGLPFHF